MVSVEHVDRPRLRLAIDSNDFWASVVLGDGSITEPQLLTGQAHLKAAVERFDAKLDALLSGVTHEQALGRLKDLQARVRAGLKFLVYEVDTAAEVGVIFETLNERGRPLSDLEKTKNYLLYLSRQIPDGRATALADTINGRWAEIFTALGGVASGMEDQLLRGHWLATINADPRTWFGVGSIKERFDRSQYVPGGIRLAAPETGVEDPAAAWDALFDHVNRYVIELRACARFLSESLRDDAEYVAFGAQAGHVRERSAALRRTRITALFRPLLFACRLHHPDDGLLFGRLLDLCERYAARVFVISQRRANAGQSGLFRLAHDLYGGRDPDDVLGAIRAVLWRYAPDDRLQDALSSLTENWFIRQGHKYFLYEYEQSLTGAAIPEFTFFTEGGRVQRTTEHILPQHPDATAGCWWDRFTADQHAQLRHALGNLVLTHDTRRTPTSASQTSAGSPQRPGRRRASATRRPP